MRFSGNVRPTIGWHSSSSAERACHPPARRSLIDNPAFLEQLESLDYQPLLSGFASESIDEKEEDGRSFQPIWPEPRKKEPRGFNQRFALVSVHPDDGARWCRDRSASGVRAGVAELL